MDTAPAAAPRGSLRAWWRSGAAWSWFSLFTVTLSAALMLGLLLLVTGESLRYVWPDAVEEWIVRDDVGAGQRMFVKPRRTLGLATDGDDRAQVEAWLVDRLDGHGVAAGWRLETIPVDDIVRRGRPRSLALLVLSGGGQVVGYPVAWRGPAEAAEMVSASGAGSSAEGRDEGIDAGPGARVEPPLLDRPEDGLRGLRARGAAGHRLVLELDDGQLHAYRVDQIDALLRPNAMGVWAAAAAAAARAWTFLSHGPDDGAPGIFPAIVGTVLLVFVMSVLLVPVGVLTAVYLHEYAPQNALTGLIRAAISNLAGVPGIVYGVFVLGVFVYGAGGRIDAWLFTDQQPLPVFGTGGLLWSALALALLTLPVVISATEEGLSRVPHALRLGALALGATRTEMVWTVVVQAARPALLTGLVLAVARAAGEVAPLLLLGAIADSSEPMLDSAFPYLHVERPFMHLGYQVYDFTLQAGEGGDAGSLAFATTLVLVLLVVVLNLAAFRLRARLGRRFAEP
jgi:phosphate transport system permease protein